MGDLNLVLDDQRVRLLPERAAFWADAETLIASDLHWGKSEALQLHGVPMPSAALGSDLQRLSETIRRTGAERVLVLGDLIHAASSLTPAVERDVAAWRESVADVALVLLRGNHDRGLRFPASWKIDEMKDGTTEGPFCFTHDGKTPEATAKRVWGGHIHPSVVLGGGRDRMRLPCFVVGQRSVLLPAFGVTTGTYDVALRRDDRVFAVAGSSVCEVPVR